MQVLQELKAEIEELKADIQELKADIQELKDSKLDEKEKKKVEKKDKYATDEEVELFKLSMLDLDIDPDRYDLNEPQARRSIKYIQEHIKEKNSPKGYIEKSLKSYLKPTDNPATKEEIYWKDNEIEPYLNLDNEKLFQLYQKIKPEQANKIGGVEKLKLNMVKKTIIQAIIDAGHIEELDGLLKEFEETKQAILDCWNKAGIVERCNMTAKAEEKLYLALQDYTIEEIKKAIINYGKIVNSPKYFFKYKWTLEEFLMRGIAKFVNDECFKNFLSNKNVYVPYREDDYDDIKF